MFNSILLLATASRAYGDLKGAAGSAGCPFLRLGALRRLGEAPAQPSADSTVLDQQDDSGSSDHQEEIESLPKTCWAKLDTPWDSKKVCRKTKMLEKAACKGCGYQECKSACLEDPLCTNFALSATEVCATFSACDGFQNAKHTWHNYGKIPCHTDDKRYLVDHFQCAATKSGKPIPTSDPNADADLYDEVFARFAEVMQRDLPGKYSPECTDDSCPWTDFVGCVVRLAGHDLMDFRPNDSLNPGGSDGCLDFDEPENGGLEDCVDSDFGMAGNMVLHTIYDEFCDKVSLADYVVLAAEAVMALARPSPDQVEETKLRFRNNFEFGRTTATSCPFTKGRLADPEKGCPGLESHFVSTVFGPFTTEEEEDHAWKLTAALMGTHTLGRAEKSNSGYRGWWSDRANSGIFNNNYYHSLLFKAWGPEQVGPGKNQWVRVDKGRGLNGGKDGEFMLNTDMCLAFDTGFNDFNALGAFDADGNKVAGPCECMWVTGEFAVAITGNPVVHDFCGNIDTDLTKDRSFELDVQDCCVHDPNGKYHVGCDDQHTPGTTAKAGAHVQEFAASEAAWLDSFHEAWTIATMNGME